jgi:hypothetical protein
LPWLDSLGSRGTKMRSYRRVPFYFATLVLLICFGSNAAYTQWGYPRVWNVYPGPDPEATRLFIQSVIDRARDGDVIYFNRGTYDFSAAPPNYQFQNGGALKIIDKSLTIKGARGSLLVGAPVVIDATGMNGINCFLILNPDANKDVVVDGLAFNTFMTGIVSIRLNNEPVNNIYYPNLRNFTVKNCTFKDIKRNGVACAGVQGNIMISNNGIYGDRAASRIGIYLDWLYEPGKLEWQPDNTLITINDNSIAGFNYSGILSNRSSRMQITGNNISNSGCGIIFNVGHKNGGTVSNNILSDIANEGILVQGYTLLVNNVLFPSVAQGLKLTYNTLINIWGVGIEICGDVAHSNCVAYNRINMLSGPGNDQINGLNCAIRSDGHDEQYAYNMIRGSGFQAILLGSQASWTPGVPDWGAHHERFFGNSVSGFAPQDPNSPETLGWHYELTAWTHDNFVLGIRTEHATYLDNGANNTLLSVYPYISPTVATSLTKLATSKTPQRPKIEAATI